MEYISQDNIQNVIRARSPNTMYAGKRPNTGGTLGGQRRSKKVRSNYNEELTGYLSRSQQGSPNKNRFGPPAVNDIIDTLVMQIFNKYDKDRNGYLDKTETLKLLDEILINQGRPKTTISQFNRFFADFDINGDGVISRGECATFVRRFLGLGGNVIPKSHNTVDLLVDKIFDKFDKDRSGVLEPRECLKLTDEILKNQGRPPTTWSQFKQFFDDFDTNGDGVISRKECAGFVREFLAASLKPSVATRGRDPIEQLVNKLFAKFDRDRSGFLEKNEVLKLLDEILLNQGRPKTTWN